MAKANMTVCIDSDVVDYIRGNKLRGASAVCNKALREYIGERMNMEDVAAEATAPDVAEAVMAEAVAEEEKEKEEAAAKTRPRTPRKPKAAPAVASADVMMAAPEAHKPEKKKPAKTGVEKLQEDLDNLKAQKHAA